MNKTLYLRDEDGPIWDRARDLSGEKLSAVIVTSLKDFIARKEAESKGFEKILVKFNDASDKNLPKAKSFYGRWITAPDKPFTEQMEEQSYEVCFAIALTVKGNVVVCSWIDNSWAGSEKKYNEIFEVFPSFEVAASNRRLNNAIVDAMEKLGVAVEEMDI